MWPAEILNRVYNKLTGALRMELTGRNIEEIYAFNALAITNTNPYFSNIDTGKYRRIFIIAESTLDQNVDVLIRLVDTSKTTMTWDGTTWKKDADCKITIPGGDTGRYVLNTKLNMLNIEGIKSLVVRAQCLVAPTSGSLTITVWGVLN